MHRTKRRRVDADASILAKPFRSPLRPVTNCIAPQSAYHTQATNGGDELPPVLRHELQQPTTSPDRNDMISQHDHRRQRLALTSQLTHLTKSVDTVTQALQHLTHPPNINLQPLITTWRQLSRDCAEDLFHATTRRIEDMGGISVWLERSREKASGYDNHYGWDIKDSEKKELDAPNAEYLVEMQDLRDEAQANAGKYGLDRDTAARSTLENRTEVDEEDEHFTIDMMLGQLNVELDTIGYDRHAQQWKD